MVSESIQNKAYQYNGQMVLLYPSIIISNLYGLIMRGLGMDENCFILRNIFIKVKGIIKLNVLDLY